VRFLEMRSSGVKERPSADDMISLEPREDDDDGNDSDDDQVRRKQSGDDKRRR
jgi:hypothetical protein